MNNFDDEWEEMKRDQKRVGFAFALWFGFVAVCAIGLLGLGVWAVIELVQWVTSK